MGAAWLAARAASTAAGEAASRAALYADRCAQLWNAAGMRAVPQDPPAKLPGEVGLYGDVAISDDDPNGTHCSNPRVRYMVDRGLAPPGPTS
jgi:hypothetical protein